MARFSAIDQILQGMISQSRVGTGEPGCQQWNVVLLNRLMVSSKLCHTETPLPLSVNNKSVGIRKDKLCVGSNADFLQVSVNLRHLCLVGWIVLEKHIDWVFVPTLL